MKWVHNDGIHIVAVMLSQSINKNLGNATSEIQEKNKKLNEYSVCLFHLQDGTPVEHRGAHEHHAVAWDGGRGGIVDVVWFENHFTVGGHGDAISVGQRQGFVVVQNWVEVLDPDGVNGPVEDYPDVLSWGQDEKIWTWVNAIINGPDAFVFLRYIEFNMQQILDLKKSCFQDAHYVALPLKNCMYEL